MAPLNFNVSEIVCADYSTRSVGSVEVIAELKTATSMSAIDCVKKQMIAEIEGIQAFRKKMKEQYPDLLMYARP